MIRDYSKESVLDIPSQSCTVYRAKKDGKDYLMHEYQNHNANQQYSFKVRRKLSTVSHIVPIQEEFTEGTCKYYITKYMEIDLLRDLLQRKNHVYDFPSALRLIATLIELSEEMHSKKLIYRNIRPEKIRIQHGEPYVYDFSMSQFTKRKERLFDVVGCLTFLAPEFFSEDGYGPEVDIWAIAVLFHFMLFARYPFNFKSNDESVVKEQFHSKCASGFKLDPTIEANSILLKNKFLENFFKKIFNLDPSQRISTEQVKSHKIFEGYFSQQLPQDMLEAIQEGRGEESAILSQLHNHPAAALLMKQSTIISFIEHSAESLMIDCAQIIPEEIRLQVNFALLKVGMQRIEALLSALYGQREFPFEISKEEWQSLKTSSVITQERERLDRQRKILAMLYKSACRDVASEQSYFFREQVPKDFNTLKIDYRTTLMKMFDMGRAQMKKKDNLTKKLSRKLVENLTRLIMLHLINRLFDSESVEQDLNFYFHWGGNKSLLRLDEWIQTEKVANLRIFMKSVALKYL